MDKATKAKWKERWARLPKWLSRVLVVLFGLVLCGGLWLSHWHESRLEESWLRGAYTALEDFKTPTHTVYSPLFSLYAERGDWERLFGDELRKRLKNPEDVDRRIEHEWGIAYAALKAPSDDWVWHQDMDEATQAEMVRYLCFRVGAGLWRRYAWCGDVGDALRAIDTYPSSALEQNQARLAKTLRMVLEANFPVTPNPAHVFLAKRLDEAWARDILWDALTRYELANWMPLFGSGPTDDPFARRNLLQILWEQAKAGDPHAAELVLRFAEYDDRQLENTYREHKAVVGEWRETIRARRERLQDVAEGRATDEAPEAAP